MSLLTRFLSLFEPSVVAAPPPGILPPPVPEPVPAPRDFNAVAIEVAAALARRFEGLYLRPYLCPAGVPSIGYGATYYPNGRRVTLSDAPITREQAEEMLLWMVRTVYLPAVLKLCQGIDTPERLAAIIDWTFNLGAGNLKASTLRKRVNAGRWADVPAEIRKWNRGGGRVLRGLVLRREAEAVLI
ncbi:lysozyme [Cupriavidus necator]|uniref:lysozyme n=1 Tax=Cupriavidus necator TaxID=106590 RepID=UPI0009B8FAEF|nr:lysozyme [Cupriavidus necator]